MTVPDLYFHEAGRTVCGVEGVDVHGWALVSGDSGGTVLSVEPHGDGQLRGLVSSGGVDGTRDQRRVDRPEAVDVFRTFGLELNPHRSPVTQRSPDAGPGSDPSGAGWCHAGPVSFVWTRAWTAAAAGVAVLAVAGGVTGYAVTHDGGGQGTVAPPVVATTAPAAPGPTPSPTASLRVKPVDPLTGGRVVDGPVLAVKVENIALARPQVGLYAADVVFAEQVEGAQTRLVAVYHSRFPRRLGPVRSARSTDVQLLPLFGHPGLVYSGANPRVQAKIDRSAIVPVYRETRDEHRVAPHNVFVDLAAIAKSERKVGHARSIGWTFSSGTAQARAGARATHATSRVGQDTFRFDWTGGRWTVRWNGETYADGDSDQVTKADNVVVMHVHDHADGNKDVLGAPSVQSDTKGAGPVSVYRDGHRVDGTWRRVQTGGPMTFTDRDGKAIALHPGQTWVTLQG